MTFDISSIPPQARVHCIRIGRRLKAGPATPVTNGPNALPCPRAGAGPAIELWTRE